MINMNDKFGELERKLMLENLTRCCNCWLIFCSVGKKEDVVDCGDFDEMADDLQVCIVKLCEAKKSE